MARYPILSRPICLLVRFEWISQSVPGEKNLMVGAEPGLKSVTDPLILDSQTT